MQAVWVFNGAMARFPSGVFTSLDHAKAWIKSNRLTGVLTQYPLDQGVYDWAVAKDLFLPQEEKQRLPAFIGSFTCAAMEHMHFEDGLED